MERRAVLLQSLPRYRPLAPLSFRDLVGLAGALESLNGHHRTSAKQALGMNSKCTCAFRLRGIRKSLSPLTKEAS